MCSIVLGGNQCSILRKRRLDSISWAEKLLVLLRDGRKLMGILRSFDQFGLYVIRGENVVLIGELDLEREELPPHMTRVSSEEIKRGEQLCSTRIDSCEA
ncbi:Sm-like protein lsm1b [Thalictrum thalictroides]|uniref:Sm-like protein lsm1b n=1 Tax=Thalictrum thalictroides TaxID=46969 RepID=A0A7J6VIK4_THATH|nr:Sm-like protein lsm1b [Thalictrum thalictroides]